MRQVSWAGFAAVVSLSAALVVACATSVTDPGTGDQDAAPAPSATTTSSDDGAPPPVDSGTPPKDSGPKDTGSQTDSNPPPPVDSGGGGGGDCDMSNTLQVIFYEFELSQQSSPVPCPCGPTDCCFMMTACVGM